MAPHGPPGSRARRLPQPLNLVGGGFVGERVDPLGAGVVERGVELGEGAGELLAPRCAVRDRLLALLLVAGDGSQPSRRSRSAVRACSRRCSLKATLALAAAMASWSWRPHRRRLASSRFAWLAVSACSASCRALSRSGS